MHRMHPALSLDADGRRAVVWHIAAEDAVMLCGTDAPFTSVDGPWLQLPEEPCDHCQLVYRQLLSSSRRAG